MDYLVWSALTCEVLQDLFSALGSLDRNQSLKSMAARAKAVLIIS